MRININKTAVEFRIFLCTKGWKELLFRDILTTWDGGVHEETLRPGHVR